MGWFSSACSLDGAAVSSNTRTVEHGVTAILITVKEVAEKTIWWLAEKAENFVDGVEKVWETVKPYVAQARAALQYVAAGTAFAFPLFSGLLLVLDKMLELLTLFDNSPKTKKLTRNFIDWLIKRAQHRQSKKAENEPMTEGELTEARQHQENFRFIDREINSPELRQQIELASVFNDYEIANADLKKTIENAPNDFEHYLRLRATQKLLAMAEKSFRTANTIYEISPEDIFLVRIASDLIKENPELSHTAALRLDRILTEKHGKKLLPFVFEELIASWAKRAETLNIQWGKDNNIYAKNATLYKFLLGAEAIQSELSSEEIQQLAQLKTAVPLQKEALNTLATRQRDMERYVGAAEGLLQVLEKTPEQIEAEDKAYLLEDGSHIGKLLIQCAQTDKPFSELGTEDQSLLTDYANIFKNESKIRMKSLLEVAA
jgi:hypothetical protein